MAKILSTETGDNVAATAPVPSQKAERMNPAKRWDVISTFLGDTPVPQLCTLKVLVDVVNHDITVKDLDEQSVRLINRYLNGDADAETKANNLSLIQHRMRRGKALVDDHAKYIPDKAQSLMKDFLNEMVFVLEPSKKSADNPSPKAEESGSQGSVHA